MPILPAFLLAAAVAFGAHRTKALSPGGAVAASAVGAAALAAGWPWALTLLAFFLPSSLLSRLRSHGGEGIGEKSGPRDAAQVLANGGIPAIAALVHLAGIPGPWAALYAGALAAASADTWATEIGRLSPSPPRLISTGRRVPAGISGGVTWYGSMAALAGATSVALAATITLLAPTGAAPAIAAAGALGALADSLLGATVQERRICDVCGLATEQTIHRSCGAPTRVVGGVKGLNNDAVNLLAGVVGAACAVLLH